MGLKELIEYYEEFSPEEVKKSLDSNLILAQATGELNPGYILMLEFAGKKDMLNKEEIKYYKIQGYDALASNLYKNLK